MSLMVSLASTWASTRRPGPGLTALPLVLWAHGCLQGFLASPNGLPCERIGVYKGLETQKFGSIPFGTLAKLIYKVWNTEILNNSHKKNDKIIGQKLKIKNKHRLYNKTMKQKTQKYKLTNHIQYSTKIRK